MRPTRPHTRSPERTSTAVASPSITTTATSEARRPHAQGARSLSPTPTPPRPPPLPPRAPGPPRPPPPPADGDHDREQHARRPDDERPRVPVVPHEPPDVRDRRRDVVALPRRREDGADDEGRGREQEGGPPELAEQDPEPPPGRAALPGEQLAVLRPETQRRETRAGDPGEDLAEADPPLHHARPVELVEVERVHVEASRRRRDPDAGRRAAVPPHEPVLELSGTDAELARQPPREPVERLVGVLLADPVDDEDRRLRRVRHTAPRVVSAKVLGRTQTTCQASPSRGRGRKRARPPAVSARAGGNGPRRPVAPDWCRCTSLVQPPRGRWFCYHPGGELHRPGRTIMPNITVQWYAGRTDQQRREIVAAITDAMVKIARTTPDQVHIVFQDVEKSNWGVNGRLASDT